MEPSGDRPIGVRKRLAVMVAISAFHISDGAMPAALLASVVIANGAIGLVLGLLYAAYGFELVMLGHAVAHLLTALLAG